MSELPPIHLINLDRSLDRLQWFKVRNAHLRQFVRTPATDGALLDREELRRSGYIGENLSYPPGSLGCSISHVKLWELAVRRGESITVLEDDVVVCHQFEERAQQVLSLIPSDWDFVQWGYDSSPLYFWVDLGVSKVRMEAYGGRRYAGQTGSQEFQACKFPAVPLKLLHSFGFQGYSISTKGARLALDYCLPLRDRLITFPEAGVVTPDVGLDVTLCGAYPSLKAYICVPQLIMPSDEQGSIRIAINEESAT